MAITGTKYYIALKETRLILTHPPTDSQTTRLQRPTNRSHEAATARIRLWARELTGINFAAPPKERHFVFDSVRFLTGLSSV